MTDTPTSANVHAPRLCTGVESLRLAWLPALLLSACASGAWAQETTASASAQRTTEDAEHSMPVMEVQAQSLESRVYDRETMDTTPEGDRDITSLIASHPAVRLNPSMSDQGNHGSLAPESFSIHGESPYQNQFLIDGISGTNAINPQEGNLSQAVSRVPGFSQAYNIDTDLLDQVQVHDSKVPVEFGRFQGGVVNAKIKTPKGLNAWSVKRSFNSSNLTQQRMPEHLQEEWLHGEAGYAAQWKKHFSSVQGDVQVSEDTAALLSFSRRESLIQRQARELDPHVVNPTSADTRLVMQDASDRVDNFLAKLHTHWDADTESNLLLKYADRQEDLVSNYFTNQKWTHRQRAMGLGLDVMRKVQGGALELKLGIDQMDAARNAEGHEYVTQQFADKTLNYYTGGYGDTSLDQRQTSAKLRFDADTVQTGAVQHKWYAGLDWQGTQADFVRKQDVYTTVQKQGADGQQVISSRSVYRAGKVGVGYNAFALYLSDTMQWGNWSWTAAARWDRDNFLHNSNVSPRTRLDWDVGGQGRTQLGLGWSRYYGMDMLGYALEQGKSQMLTYLIKNGKEVNEAGTVSRHSFDGLQTPYSDEWAFHLNQQVNSYLEAGFSYVHRASRDAVTKEGTSTSGYTYTNNGSGHAETAALSLRTLKPWKWAAADWSSRVDFSWQDKYTNHDSTLGWAAEGLQPDDMVVVNGQKMQRKDKPSGEFNQPRKLSWSFAGHWRKTGLKWGNRINWMSSRTGLAYMGTTKEKLDNFASQRLASYWTWDTSITYTPAAWKGVTLNLDVLNLLNVQEPLAIGSALQANNVRYRTGREIWLNVGYQF